MIRKLTFSLLISAFCLTLSYAADETMTITTYYPSPYGSYNSLQTNKLGIGDTNDDGKITSADAPTENGEVWIKGPLGIGTTATTDSLMVIKGASSSGSATDVVKGIEPGSGTGVAWQLANSGMANNFFMKGNVGIGTRTPNVKLDILGPTGEGTPPVFRMIGGEIIPQRGMILTALNSQGDSSWQNPGNVFRKITVERKRVKTVDTNGKTIITSDVYEVTLPKPSNPNETITESINVTGLGDGKWANGTYIKVCRSEDKQCIEGGSSSWSPPPGTGVVEIARSRSKDTYCILAHNDDDRPKSFMIGADVNRNSCNLKPDNLDLSCLKISEAGKELPMDSEIDQLGFICFP